MNEREERLLQSEGAVLGAKYMAGVALDIAEAFDCVTEFGLDGEELQAILVKPFVIHPTDYDRLVKDLKNLRTTYDYQTDP